MQTQCNQYRQRTHHHHKNQNQPFGHWLYPLKAIIFELKIMSEVVASFFVQNRTQYIRKAQYAKDDSEQNQHGNINGTEERFHSPKIMMNYE